MELDREPIEEAEEEDKIDDWRAVNYDDVSIVGTEKWRRNTKAHQLDCAWTQKQL